MNMADETVQLVPLFDLEATTRRSAVSSGGLGRGWVVIDITGGSFAGGRLSGKVVASGGDWVSLMDTAARLDVRMVLETDDGVPILFAYRGVAPLQGDPQRARVSGQFEAPAGAYDWLNGVHAVGFGEGDGNLARYRFFEMKIEG
jgi:hypothetical protein